MCKEYKLVQCLFCGRDVNLPLEVKRNSGEISYVFSGECICDICKIKINFPEVKMLFREKEIKEKSKFQRSNGCLFLMGCPAEGCTGKIKVKIDGATEKRFFFTTLEKANENKHLSNKGNFESVIFPHTSNCSECQKVWEIEVENQTFSFETERKI